MKFKVTLILALIMYSLDLSAQMSISEINLAHQYAENKNYNVQILGFKGEKDNVRLFAAYKLPDTLNTLMVSFWGAQDYQQPVIRIDSLLQEEVYLGKHDDRHYYQYIINTPFPIVALELVTGENTSQIYDYEFNEQQLDVVLFSSETDLPVINRWVNSGKYYYPVDFNSADLEFFVTYFSHQYEAAIPPMSSNDPRDKNLSIDSVFIAFDEEDLNFENEGYYLFQKDTLSAKGFGWNIYNNAFPKYNQVEQLIPPMRYITTTDEYQKVASSMTKKAFDNLWLKIGKTPESARSMISKYYKRVENANMLFTSYKEGWKTDKGMVYIIYGPPHQVQRKEDGEVWWYFDGEETRQVFQFAKFSHVFYPHNYVLIRDAEHRRSWFTAVDLIRNNQF